MSAVSKTNTNLPLCANPARTFLYEKVGTYFYDEPQTVAGTCTICGSQAMIVNEGKKKEAPYGKCVAQLSLTAKRKGVAKEATDNDGVVSETDGGSRSSIISAGNWMVVASNYQTVVTSVAPVKPLPPELKAGRIKTIDQSFSQAFIEMLQKAEAPLFVGRFTNKSNMALKLSLTKSVISVLGDDTMQELDVARLNELCEIFGQFKKAEMDSILKLRRNMSMYAPGDAEYLKVMEDFKSFQQKHPTLSKYWNRLPSGTEPEVTFAKKIAYGE